MKKNFKVFIFTCIFGMLGTSTINAYTVNIDEQQSTIDKITYNENILTDVKEELASSSISSYSMQMYTLKAQADERYRGIVMDKKNTSTIYVEKDGYHYIYSRLNTNVLRIYRYCIETNSSEEMYYHGLTSIYGEYIKDKTIYVLGYEIANSNNMTVYAYNTVTDSIEYTQELPVSSNDFVDCFCVDDNENYYLIAKDPVDKKDKFMSFNREGKLIDTSETSLKNTYSNVQFTAVLKDNRYIAFKAYRKSGMSYFYDDYVIKLDNGHFEGDNMIYLIRNQGGMNYKFLNEDKTKAMTNLGEIITIDYNANNDAGIELHFVNSIKYDNYVFNIPFLYSYDNLYAQDDNYIYVGGKNGMIYIYDWQLNKITNAMSIGEEKYIYGIYKIGNMLYIEYKNIGDTNYYLLTLSIDDIDTIKENINIIEHSSTRHTKYKIKSKYTAALPVVTSISQIYKEKPSIVSPYKAGSINEQTITDTLNQENYYRWLAGLNEVTLNEEYMSWSQKGAVVLAANNELTHYPSKPNNMNDEFYSQGYASTSGEFGYGANCSQGDILPYTIKGYIDDVYNVYPDVGHRLSLLNPTINEISFGEAGLFSTLNVFSDYTLKTSDKYTSWPSPGYFPIECINSNAMWSININASDLQVSGDRYVVLHANGKEYQSGYEDSPISLNYDNIYRAYYFSLPDEVTQYLTDGTNSIKDSKKVEVELHGLADNLGNTYIIKYTVEFFSIKNITYLPGDLDGNGYITANDAAVALDIYKNNNATAEDIKIGDLDGNKIINAQDAAMILDMYKNGQ